jgi:hypothetical protein
MATRPRVAYSLPSSLVENSRRLTIDAYAPVVQEYRAEGGSNRR